VTDEEFLKGFAEIVAADEAGFSLDTPLSGLEGWDSVAFLGAMVFVEENMGVTLTPEVLVNARTVSEILASARAL
jgi:acyl carrier protein